VCQKNQGMERGPHFLKIFVDDVGENGIYAKEVVHIPEGHVQLLFVMLLECDLEAKRGVESVPEALF